MPLDPELPGLSESLNPVKPIAEIKKLTGAAPVD
jgi:hypothetical protein